MDTPDFFDFHSKFLSSTVTAYSIGLKTVLDPSGKILLESDDDKLTLGDYKGIDFPVVFKQEKGKKWDDILNTGYVSLYLISDKLKAVLEENNLTGWKTYPTKLVDKKGVEILGYHGFSIVGRCDPVDYSKSEIIEKQIREDGPFWTYYKGIHIDLEKWDGSDFFLPKGTFAIYVTSKVADLMKKNKITNLRLENLADSEIDESTVKLSYKNRNFLTNQ